MTEEKTPACVPGTRKRQEHLILFFNRPCYATPPYIADRDPIKLHPRSYLGGESPG